jgi:ribosomal protein L37AE/L43A
VTDLPIEYLCAICQRRPYERAQVCNPCRRWLAADLGQIAGLSLLLPAAVAPTNGNEGGLPIRITVVDLTLTNASTEPIHDEHDDQHGEIPIRARLDSWVENWATRRGKGERLPIPTVPVLCSWLLVRLDDECDQHPAINDFAREIRILLATIRRVLNMEKPQTVRYGAPCPRCGTKTLRRAVGAEWIECDDCGRLWGEDDYAELVRDTVPSDRLYTAAQVATMLGSTRDAVYKRVRRGLLRPDIGPWGGMHFWKADIMLS